MRNKKDTFPPSWNIKIDNNNDLKAIIIKLYVTRETKTRDDINWVPRLSLISFSGSVTDRSRITLNFVKYIESVLTWTRARAWAATWHPQPFSRAVCNTRRRRTRQGRPRGWLPPTPDAAAGDLAWQRSPRRAGARNRRASRPPYPAPAPAPRLFCALPDRRLRRRSAGTVPLPEPPPPPLPIPPLLPVHAVRIRSPAAAARRRWQRCRLYPPRCDCVVCNRAK